MTKAEIRNRMEKLIRDSFDPMDEDEIAELIKEDDIIDFLWGKDWGREIFEKFMEDNSEDIKDDFLEEIYDEIEVEGLDW